MAGKHRVESEAGFVARQDLDWFAQLVIPNVGGEGLHGVVRKGPEKIRLQREATQVRRFARFFPRHGWHSWTWLEYLLGTGRVRAKGD